MVPDINSKHAYVSFDNYKTFLGVCLIKDHQDRNQAHQQEEKTP